jgi:hypothetical protein
LKVYKIEYTGKWLSINAAYSSNRWQRTKVKKEYKAIFKPLILNLAITQPIKQYRLEVTYWSKMDSLNLCAGIKILEDCMTELDVIINDDKRYQQGISIAPDNTLNHNTYIIKLIEL